MTKKLPTDYVIKMIKGRKPHLCYIHFKRNGESKQGQKMEQADMTVIYWLLKVYFMFGFI